jgi:mutator protein MutT
MSKLIGVGIIWDGDKLLIDRRPPTGFLAGLWEFPGGKVEHGETVTECIAREIQEELGLIVNVGIEFVTVNHAYPEFSVTLAVHHCQYLGGVPQLIACDAVEWVNIEDLPIYDFPAANAQIIAALQAIVPPTFS